MKIAQVAPLLESVPPKFYGGTERVVSYLTEELVRQGHDVTLFASGDSLTSAKLISVNSESLRLKKDCVDRMAYHILMLETLAKMASEFDVIHFHIDYLHFPLSRALGLKQLTTLHGRLDLPELSPLFDEFRDMPVVSISDSQRAPLPQANWINTVPHGLPLDLLRFNPSPDACFAFLGRVSPEKRLDRAIEIAVHCGVKLRVAAKVDAVDQAYFNETIRPLLANPLIEFIGEIGDADKSSFLGSARALLFPIDWPEPFGLVMIEALACGTPVIAYRCGSVPEILDDGLTGYVVDDFAGAVRAVNDIDKLSRRKCRQIFEKRFSVTRMAEEYVRIYESIIDASREPVIDSRRKNLHSREFFNRRTPRAGAQT